MAEIRLPAAFSEIAEPARYKAYYGGRGSGKSHSVATALVIMGASRPLRVGCFREVQNSIRDSVKKLLDNKIRLCGLGNFYRSTDTEIRGRNGTSFIFAGLRTNPDSMKSMEALNIAWVEEAARASQRSLDLLIPTIREPGSELWFTWNPHLPTDPVDAMFRGKNGPPPRSIVRRVNYDDNPWFPPELEAERLWDLRRDPDKHAHIWMGEYLRNSEARVFRNWRVEEFETPKDDPAKGTTAPRFFFGADWGFSVDPTVLVRCWIDGRTLYVDREVYKVGCEIDQTPALFDALDPEAPEMARAWPIRADSARPETISYMRRNGYTQITAATKGPGSIEDGIQFLKSYDIVVHPRCRHTIDELTSFSYKTDPLTNEVLPVLLDRKNHVIDALRYAVELVRRSNFAVVGRYGMG
jgi:phage terminase large subunit